MDFDQSYSQLEEAFRHQKDRALCFIRKHNATLPSDSCPSCHEEGHVPGLRCPACGYRHKTPWAILRDTEFGYEVIPLTNRKVVIAEFKVE